MKSLFNKKDNEGNYVEINENIVKFIKVEI